MSLNRLVKLFRNGSNQAVRIPREFELPGTRALLRKEGNRIILEPAAEPSLLEVLEKMQPLDEDPIGEIPDPLPEPVDF